MIVTPPVEEIALLKTIEEFPLRIRLANEIDEEAVFEKTALFSVRAALDPSEEAVRVPLPTVTAPVRALLPPKVTEPLETESVLPDRELETETFVITKAEAESVPEPRMDP